MGFLDKKIVHSVMLGPSKDHGMEFDVGGRNDLWDWDGIRVFTYRFADSRKR